MKYVHRMMGNSWQVIKKNKKTINLFVPPLEAPGAPLGGHAPSLRITALVTPETCLINVKMTIMSY